MSSSKCICSWVCKILLLVGGINWGLMGVGALMGNDMNAWNVVHMILVSVPTLEAIVYVLVGVAALLKIFGCKCNKCAAGCCSTSTESSGSGQNM